MIPKQKLKSKIAVMSLVKRLCDNSVECEAISGRYSNDGNLN